MKVKVKVCEEGGLSRIIHAIQTYPDDPELCECVCRAISSLAGCSKMEIAKSLNGKFLLDCVLIR